MDCRALSIAEGDVKICEDEGGASRSMCSMYSGDSVFLESGPFSDSASASQHPSKIQDSEFTSSSASNGGLAVMDQGQSMAHCTEMH